MWDKADAAYDGVIRQRITFGSDYTSICVARKLPMPLRETRNPEGD